MTKIGTKIYLVISENGVDLFNTRQDARNWNKSLGGLIIETPLTPYQQTKVQGLVESGNL